MITDLSSSAAVSKVNSSTPLHLVSDLTGGRHSLLDSMTTMLDDPDWLTADVNRA
jgi:hypothetical protein